MLSPCARGLTTSPSLVPKHPSLAPNTKAYLGRCHTSGNMKGHVATFSMPTRAWCTGHEGGGDHTSGTGSLPQCSCRETSGPAPPAGEVPGATGRTPSRGGGDRVDTRAGMGIFGPGAGGGAIVSLQRLEVPDLPAPIHLRFPPAVGRQH